MKVWLMCVLVSWALRLPGRNEQKAVEPSYRRKDVDVRSVDVRFVKLKPRCV